MSPAVALVLAVAAVGATSDVDPAAVLERAQKLSGAGDYRGALALLGPTSSAPGLAPADRIQIFGRIALAHANLSEHDAAQAAATRADALARQLGEAKAQGSVAHLRGELARLRGDAHEAIRHYEEGLHRAGLAADAGLVRRCHRGLAAAHQALGDWARVLDYTRRAFEANPSPDDAARASHLLLLGVAHYEFRERDAAERHFRDLLELAERTGRRRELSLALGELGMLYWEFDRDRERSLAHHDRALAVARELRLPDLEANWLLNSANVFRDGGDLDEALRRYRAALALAGAADGGSASVLAKNIGQVLGRMGRHDEAEAWLLRAKEAADRRGPRHIRWEARMELAQIYAALSDGGRADVMFRQSLDALEQDHANIVLEDYRIGALSRSLHKYDPYELYIDFLLARRRTEEAFAVAERSRARAFLDTLAAARDEIAPAVPAGYRKREDALLERISRHQARLRTEALDARGREEALAEVGQAETELGALRLRLAVERPAVAQARYPRLPSVNELRQKVLQAGETLVVFFLGRRSSAVWVVTQDGVEVRALPPRAVLEPAVRQYLQVLSRPSAHDTRGPAGALSRLLDVEAVVRQAGEQGRLIVVPHGVLHYLPVEALVTADGRYLVERFAVSYAPSASSLSYLRERGGRAQEGSLIAIGDPLTAPMPVAEERGLRLDAVARLKPLPHSGRELRRIGSLFAGPGVLDRERATEERLREMDLTDASILHFATHGIIDEARPERSGLALTATPPRGDGLLQMREIYRLRLRAALVTLSACESALGPEVTGEGVVGLSRAFFYAGADAVMASLWNVGDASTADWMVHFYGGVRAGLALDRAARDAKLAFLQGEGERRHPYYWAPFVLTGHAAAAAPLRPAPRWTPKALAASAALLAAVLAVAARRRRAAARGLSSSSLPRAS